MGQSVRGAMAKANVKPAGIIALTVDTTCCSVVALDQQGKPLRPCMIWMDVRSAREAGEIAATKDPFLCVNGGGAGPVSAEWMIPNSKRNGRTRSSPTRRFTRAKCCRDMPSFMAR